MPNITRGDRMGGLMTYLVGPGRENQHREPHLVAGDPAIMAWHSDAELSHEDGLSIGRALSGPKRAFGVTVPGGHVWHCSWSLRAEEGRLPDATWAAIATDVADGMGFSGSDGKAPCRWIAVHHGPSKAGNDHIHFVVSLVREDGTRAPVWNDRPRAQTLARELERRYGLQVLESRAAGRGDRAPSRTELEKAAAAGLVEPERFTLARAVRAEAFLAGSEAEFVRRLRAARLGPLPRFASGTDSVVSGYSVSGSSTGIRLGGGGLAHDLSLPRLREWAGWPDTPEAATEAAAEWRAAQRCRPPVRPGPETAVVLPPELAEAYAAEVGAMREWLHTVPVTDRVTWAAVAGESAGVFAAWSRAVEPTPGPLAHAADSLARSAQLRAGEVHGHRRAGPSIKGAALLAASIAHGGRGTVAEAVLLRQLSNTARALHDAHRAAGESRRAAEIAAVARGELTLVLGALPAAPNSPRMEQAAQISPGRTVGSVLPADLERARGATTAARDRGLDR